MSILRENLTGLAVSPFLPKGVIFDMDGLMLDTEQMYIKSCIRISGEMGWPITEEFFKSTIGITDNDAIEIYKKEYGNDYPYWKVWDAVRKELFEMAEKNGIPHKRGLLALLNKLKSLKIPLAVATSTERYLAKRKLTQAGILERFTALACGDEVERGKPEPDIFLLAAERLGVEPESCVGFEDSPAGLAGLAAAGIPSVFIKDVAEPPPEILRTVWRRCADLEVAAELFG
jgi:HAD superfamily hydrolase (TIGR01509 family)